jgi:hypothetical protein
MTTDDNHDHIVHDHIVPETDELISRLVDDAAGADDRARFETRAAGDPDLWRQLALAQRDMAALRTAYEHETAAAEQVELPGAAVRRPFAWLAFSGWAAAFLIGLFWLAMHQASTTPGPSGRTVDERRPVPMTPEEHFASYLGAPYVLNQLQPVVVDVEEMHDGRLGVHFIRRIEEFALLDPDTLPVDEYGELTSDLSELRRAEPKRSMPMAQ